VGLGFLGLIRGMLKEISATPKCYPFFSGGLKDLYKPYMDKYA